MLKDAAARAQTGVAGEGDEQGWRDGGQLGTHRRPRRAWRKRAARADDVYRDVEDLDAAGGDTHEDKARLGPAYARGGRAGPSQARRGRGKGLFTLSWEHELPRPMHG